MTIYVSIGNSDDKLPQARWAIFYGSVKTLVQMYASQVHGAWTSVSHEAWQNACFAFDLKNADDAAEMKRELSKLAASFEQESIAWAEATTTFLKSSDA